MNVMYNWIENNPDKLKFLDQDVLNANFYDKVTYVDNYLYNYLEILVNPMLTNDNMGKDAIVHFLKKPWKYDYNGVNASYWWKYGKNIYPWRYYRFIILNLIYRKLLATILLFVSVKALKKIKQLI